MEVLGWIPARGGSKGIPRKNMVSLCGQPLIGWTLDAALAAESVTRVIVSTDDDETAEYAILKGAEVHERPAHLTTGEMGMVDEAMLDTLGYLEGDEPDIVLRLQPTSPLRTAEQIDRGVRVIQHGTGGAKAAVAVVEARHHPFLIGDFAVDGFMGLDERFRLPRQDYPTAYAISGAFYGARTDYWLQHGFYGPDSVALPWSRESSVDIDGPLDLVIAEALLSRRLAVAA